MDKEVEVDSYEVQIVNDDNQVVGWWENDTREEQVASALKARQDDPESIIYLRTSYKATLERI